MLFLYSLFFGAGVAGFSYTRLGRRAGYGNTQNVITIVAVVFVLSTLVFFTILTTLLIFSSRLVPILLVISGCS